MKEVHSGSGDGVEHGVVQPFGGAHTDEEQHVGARECDGESR